MKALIGVLRYMWLFFLTVMTISIIMFVFFCVKVLMNWEDTQDPSFSFPQFWDSVIFNSALTGIIISTIAVVFLTGNYYLKVVTAKLKGKLSR